MKRILAIICVVVALFSCGCDAGFLASQPKFEDEAAQAVWDGYHDRLKEATSSKTLSYIKINEVTVTDKPMINRLLTTLQKNKPTDVREFQMIFGETMSYVTFGYPDKEVELGCFNIKQISVYYGGKTNDNGYKKPDEYSLKLDIANGEEIIALFEECGVKLN